MPKNYLSDDDDDDNELRLSNRHLHQQSEEGRIMGVSRVGDRRKSLDYIHDDDLLDVHDDIDLGSVDLSPSSDSPSVSAPTNIQGGITTNATKNISNQDIFEDVYDSFGDMKQNSYKTTKGTIITSDADDEEEQYETQSSKSINLDETIVKSILDSSESRSRKLQREILTKKYFQTTLKGFIYVCAFIAFIFVILLIANPSSSNNDNIIRYDDHDYFHDHDDYESFLNNVLNEPIQFDDRKGRSDLFSHLKNRDKELDVENEVPFFWKVPYTGDVMERIMSQCFDFVLASDMIGHVMPAALVDSDEV
jgi:hypothetical protein